MNTKLYFNKLDSKLLTKIVSEYKKDMENKILLIPKQISKKSYSEMSHKEKEEEYKKQFELRQEQFKKLHESLIIIEETSNYLYIDENRFNKEDKSLKNIEEKFNIFNGDEIINYFNKYKKLKKAAINYYFTKNKRYIEKEFKNKNNNFFEKHVSKDIKLFVDVNTKFYDIVFYFYKIEDKKILIFNMIFKEEEIEIKERILKKIKEIKQISQQMLDYQNFFEENNLNITEYKIEKDQKKAHIINAYPENIYREYEKSEDNKGKKLEKPIIEEKRLNKFTKLDMLYIIRKILKKKERTEIFEEFKLTEKLRKNEEIKMIEQFEFDKIEIEVELDISNIITNNRSCPIDKNIKIDIKKYVKDLIDKNNKENSKKLKEEKVRILPILKLVENSKNKIIGTLDKEYYKNTDLEDPKDKKFDKDFFIQYFNTGKFEINKPNNLQKIQNQIKAALFEVLKYRTIEYLIKQNKLNIKSIEHKVQKSNLGLSKEDEKRYYFPSSFNRFYNIKDNQIEAEYEYNDEDIEEKNKDSYDFKMTLNNNDLIREIKIEKTQYVLIPDKIDYELFSTKEEKTIFLNGYYIKTNKDFPKTIELYIVKSLYKGKNKVMSKRGKKFNKVKKVKITLKENYSKTNHKIIEDKIKLLYAIYSVNLNTFNRDMENQNFPYKYYFRNLIIQEKRRK